MGIPKPKLRVIPSVVSVLSYRCSGLTERLSEKIGIEQEEAENLQVDMLRFLYLCGTSPAGVRNAPTGLIDEAWHHFILFTREYESFCRKTFGRFIHHGPKTADHKIERGLALATIARAKEMFGDLSANWAVNITPPTASDCVGGVDCSDDQCSGTTNCQDD